MGPHQLVYIVDDNEAVLDSTGMLVKSAGIAVREFSSSLAFLRDFEAAPECCVILDINMPEMSGFRVIEFLRGRGITVPIILFSGRVDAVAEERARRSGAEALLTKPVAHDELLQLVQRLLARSNVAHAVAPLPPIIAGELPRLAH